MKHNSNLAIFNRASINEKVKFDIQLAFLEQPLAHGLLQALTYIGLTCDPRAPISVPNKVLRALLPNLDYFWISINCTGQEVYLAFVKESNKEAQSFKKASYFGFGIYV